MLIGEKNFLIIILVSWLINIIVDKPFEKETRIKRKINYTRFTIEDIYDPSSKTAIEILARYWLTPLPLGV